MKPIATWVALGAVAALAVTGLAWVFWPQAESSASELADDPDAAVPSKTVTQDKNSVEVKATRQAWSDGEVRFTVTLDTHTVDLSGYDALKKAKLEVGGRSLSPTSNSRETANDGHHASFILAFHADADEDLTLVLRDLAGVPEWRLRFTP